MKELVGQEIAKRVKDGEIIGIGTGSTVDFAVAAIAKRIKEEKLTIRAVPSSYETARKCEEAGIQVLSPLFSGEISWGFDGADEVDPNLRLIKGRGGALLQEKILALKCRKFVIIVDESKIVKNLGEKFPIPVEVIPEAYLLTKKALIKLGSTEVTLREGSGKFGAVISEKGNYILDARFNNIEDALESKIKAAIGVVESGLFIAYTDEVLVATSKGIEKLTRSSSK
ncbi:MAG: ribose-5-phosphate isomerase RpiA [bacterium]|nr:ribose-5-phosphate isomerase RpiA [bacterium]